MCVPPTPSRASFAQTGTSDHEEVAGTSDREEVARTLDRMDREEHEVEGPESSSKCTHDRGPAGLDLAPDRVCRLDRLTAFLLALFVARALQTHDRRTMHR